MLGLTTKILTLCPLTHPHPGEHVTAFQCSCKKGDENNNSGEQISRKWLLVLSETKQTLFTHKKFNSINKRFASLSCYIGSKKERFYLPSALIPSFCSDFFLLGASALELNAGGTKVGAAPDCPFQPDSLSCDPPSPGFLCGLL